ncbi:MAG: putative quinol monooxygenase, partial [Planctomycetota bacterium]
MSKLAVIACITLSEDSAPKYMEAAQAILEPTRAEAGCEFYGIAVDVKDSTRIWVSEQWASQEALHAHLQAPHVQAFLGTVASLE